MKLITLNIERKKHYDTVLPFLKREQSDVVCLQEVYKEDIPILENELDYKHIIYTPMTLKKGIDGITRTFGHAILTNEKIEQVETTYYYTADKDENKIPLFDKDTTTSINKALTVVKVVHNNDIFIIGNTHFTWTKDGKLDRHQKQDLPNLLAIAKKYPKLILCGDFNAPRGRKVWSTLSKHYTDNIPTNIKNTLDPIHHRVPTLEYVVDGIFTTPEYKVLNITVKNNVSDHCAIVSEISTSY